MAAPTVVDSTSSGAANTATATTAKPAGLQNGDTLVFVGFGRASVTVATEPPGDPAGAALYATGNSGGTTASHVRADVWVKPDIVAASEPANYSAVYSGALFGGLFCVALRGCDPSQPIDIVVITADGDLNTTIVTPTADVSHTSVVVLRAALISSPDGVSALAHPGTTTELKEITTTVGTSRVAGAIGRDNTPTDPTGTASWTATITAPSTAGRAVGVTIAVTNPQLRADAGSDQTVASGATGVELDGSDSTNATTHSWTQLEGPAVVITNEDQAVATIDAPVGPAELVFQDEVGDGVSTDTDTCTVHVEAPAQVLVRRSGAWVGADVSVRRDREWV